MVLVFILPPGPSKAAVRAVVVVLDAVDAVEGKCGA